MRCSCAICSILLGVLMGAGCGGDDSSSSEPTGAGSEGSGTETGEGSSTGTSANAFPRFVTTLDLSGICSIPSASEVAFEATRFGCVDAGPCTVPNPPRAVVGTSYACPMSEHLVAEVEVQQEGRYWVEAVVRLEDGSEMRECFTDDPETSEMLIGTSELNQAPTIEVSSLGEPCEP